MASPVTPPAPPTLPALFLALVRMSLTSFGGGISGWMLRDFVRRRAWLTEEEFLNAMAVTQALPGPNVVNMSIWIGHRLCGWPGALVGFAGMVLPGAGAVLLIAWLFGLVAGAPLTRLVLLGAGAAAIGLPLSVGWTAARRSPRDLVSLLLLAATFAAVALLHWPVLPVMLVAGAIGIASSWRRAGRP